MSFALTLIVVAIAAVVQRITGMGFSLVAVPLLVLLSDEREGVLVATVVGGALSTVMLATQFRDVEWKQTWPLVLVGMAATPLGVLLVEVLPGPVLLCGIGVATMAALGASRLLSRVELRPAWLSTAVTGLAAGTLHSSCGLSGPPLAIHATNAGWSQRSFAASVQLVFIGLGIATLALRGLPDTAPIELAVVSVAGIAGIGAGALLARVVSERHARIAMLVVAWAGAVVVLARGVLAVVGR